MTKDVCVQRGMAHLPPLLSGTYGSYAGPVRKSKGSRVHQRSGHVPQTRDQLVKGAITPLGLEQQFT